MKREPPIIATYPARQSAFEVLRQHLRLCEGRCRNCECAHSGKSEHDGTPVCVCPKYECHEYVPTWDHSGCFPAIFGEK